MLTHSAEAPEMKGTLELLRLLGPTIQDICSSSGTPGLSLGVIHHGSTVFRDNFGYRDVEAQLKPDSDTIYGIASLTKAFTSSILGILVDEDKISWDAPISSIVPEFHRGDIVDNATIVDFLSQQTGIGRSNQYWFGNDNGLLLSKDQIIPIVNYLRPVQPFKSSAAASNWNFAFAGEVIESVADDSWSSMVKSHLLEPLGLTRTTFWNDHDRSNIAKSYVALDDGTPYLVPPPQIAEGTIMASAMGLRSSVNDLLTWAQALLTGLADQRRSGHHTTKGLPLRNLPTIMQGKCPLMFDYPGEMGMGFMVTTLPSPIGGGGSNPMLVDAMPVVGADAAGTEVLYYQGSMAGYTTSLILLPDTQSAIVVLANSMGLNDAADWISQVVLETLLNTAEPADYVALSRAAADAQVAKFPRMKEKLEKDRVPGTDPGSLVRYEGKYFNSIGDFFIEIYLDDGSLRLAFQGLREHQSWELRHYHYTTFSWLMDRDECVKRARFTVASEGLYLLEFVEEGAGIVALRWGHESGVGPETFRKLPSSSGILGSDGSAVQITLEH